MLSMRPPAPMPRRRRRLLRQTWEALAPGLLLLAMLAIVNRLAVWAQ